MLKVIPLSYAFFLVFYFTAFTAHAQKMPGVQQTGVLAPINIRIDGKSTEWGNQFQAFNKAVNLMYTIANDNENLYLTVQAKDARVIEKILTVGLTFSVSTAGKKDEKDKENVSIIYPILSRRYTHGILVNAGDKANWSGVPARNKLSFVEALTRNDSTIASANAAFTKYATTIKVLGLKDEADTLISVYNEQRIRTGVMFDNNGVYNYELALPLKYLSLSGKQSFTYSIRLNSWGNAMSQFFSPIDPVTGQLGEQQDADPDLNSTTFLWGEYTLAKKP